MGNHEEGVLALKARLYNRESGLRLYSRVLLGKDNTGRTGMMMKITGLTRSLLSLAKVSEKDQKEPREGLPDQESTEPRDRIPDHQRERELVEDGLLQGLPRDLEDGVLEDQEVLVEGA